MGLPHWGKSLSGIVNTSLGGAPFWHLEYLIGEEHFWHCDNVIGEEPFLAL